MIELLKNYLDVIILYFPIGVIGIWRWSIWITKKIIARNYKSISENGYSNTLSIVIPVYNEDPSVFQRALESWASNDPNEMIAVIDYTDEDCIEKFKKFQGKNKNSTLIITKKPGKRAALSDGIKAAQYNIIALVDSDTIWDPNIKSTLLAPFIDPSVGGVGPRQDVLNTNTLARRLFNIHLDQRYFDEMTFIATVGNAVTCLSGRTALYRKEAIKDLCDKLENETFFGAKCISGDDKCLTRLVQEKGWKTRYQGNARVLTPGAADLTTLCKQQIRWTRNSYRSDVKSLTSKWIWKKEKFLALHMADRFIQPFTLIISPIYFLFSIIWGYWLVAGILLIWWHVSRGIKLYPHLKHRPSDIFILSFYVLSTYVMAILKIYALVTIKQQGWITRWHKNRLQVRINTIFRILKSVVPYSATASIIMLLSFGVLEYKNITAISYYDYNIKSSDVEKKIIASTNVESIVNDCYQTVLNNLENQQFRYYQIEQGDTLFLIAKKYNSNLLAIVKSNSDIIPNPNYLKIGQRLKIPAQELRNILKNEELFSFKEPKITFDEPSGTINIEGTGSIVTIPEIYNAIHNNAILEKLNNKEWLLKANLTIRKGVTLVIDGSDVSWLKLKSGTDGFIWLQSNGGNILINTTKITSWDEGSRAPDAYYEDGRSFILARQNGRMDIMNSKLSFLGYEDGLKSGVTWHAVSDSPNKYLITGQILESELYSNYSGMYLSGIVEMMIANNEIYYNTRYGIGVHNGENNFLIKNNWFHDNGNGDCS